MNPYDLAMWPWPYCTCTFWAIAQYLLGNTSPNFHTLAWAKAWPFLACKKKKILNDLCEFHLQVHVYYVLRDFAKMLFVGHNFWTKVHRMMISLSRTMFVLFWKFWRLRNEIMPFIFSCIWPSFKSMKLVIILLTKSRNVLKFSGEGLELINHQVLGSLYVVWTQGHYSCHLYAKSKVKDQKVRSW